MTGKKIEGSSVCARCKTERPQNEFARDKSRKSGFYPWCKPCAVENTRKYVGLKPEHYKAKSAECQKKRQARDMAKYGMHPARVKYLYGLSVDDYLAMHTAQRGRCMICAKEKKLVVDHCHATGRVRGLLCAGCNHALGHLNDDPEAALAASIYLKGR